MRFHPTRIHLAYLCFIFLSILLNLACSKDSDLLRDSILQDQSVSSVEQLDSATPDSEVIEEPTAEDEIIEENTDLIRTTSFPPIHDAHVQSGKGYNQNLIRLEENSRTSYLMFDLNPISEIGANIKSVTLQLTIHSDDGNGSIKIHKGTTNNWTEGSLSENTAPGIDVEVGSITKEFPLDETELIALNPELITPNLYTLVLRHVGGNDVAFASKEHADKIGPKLVVTYEAPEGSEEIIIEEETTEGTQDTTEETTDTTDNTENTQEEEQQPVNQEPMAIADANPSGGGVPLVVTFTGSNSSDDDEITSYSWNFKDGTSSSTANPTHTFNVAGIYEVELSVTDAEGLTSTDKVTITATEEQNTAPQAIVSATPTSGEAPLAVSFKGSSSTDDHSIASYKWDFKDGSITNVADFDYTYTNPGVYEAELTVTDENGLTDKETITITVTEPQNTAPVAVVGANVTSGNAPLQVQFLGSDSTDDNAVSSYSWNFKDGSTSQVANPLYTFNQPGSYEVELTVSDAQGLTNTKSVTINVTSVVQNEAPVARIFANITSGDVPLNVQFTGDQSSDNNGITSYYWDFKDGSTANSANPYHTFNATGNYLVELTVQDAAGLSNTVSVNINVSEPVTNALPGYYVATNGSSGNSGTSPSSPWSLEHAFNVARAGDVVYVKAGNYGNKQIRTKNSGYGGSPIKFIGYRNTPGDVNSSQGSTFNYGEAVDASKMPLLSGSNSSGTAFELYNAFIHLENIQINGYEIGVLSIDNATNATLKNIIVTNSGNQYNPNVYGGVGLSIRGNSTIIENSFVLNAGSEAIKLDDSDYSKISYCSVYANNASNPTDYYYLLADGTNNTVIENSRAERAPGLSHGGHGFNIKNDGSYNVIRNCSAYRTNFELTYVGVHHNTIEGGAIYGDNQWPSVMSIVGGAHDNLITGLNIRDTWTAITLATYDDRTGADASLGTNNTFENVTVQNTNRILNIGGGTNIHAKAKGYTFRNCTFNNFEFLAVVLYSGEGFKFENSSFNNGQYPVTSVEAYAPFNTLQASWSNCTWSNVNFSPPN